MNRRLPFEWVVATRFMRDGLMQTALIVSGVALGVAVIVFMSALLDGLQNNLFRRTLDAQSQIVIRAPERVARPLREPQTRALATIVQPRPQRLESVDQWQKLLEQIRGLPQVVAVSPIVSGAGFVVRAEANKPVTLTGIEPDSFLSLIKIQDKLVTGKVRPNAAEIVIGTELASDLGVGVGDKITLNTTTGASRVLTVVGIFDFGNKGVNARSVFVALRTAQSMLDLAGGATSIELNVSDPFAADVMARRLQRMTGLDVESWITSNAQFFSAVNAQQMSSNLIRFFVGLTAALGIASVLAVSVIQKSGEIGILRATGTTRGQILRVFLVQGALTGLIGSVLGSLLGWSFLQAWDVLATADDGSPLFGIEMKPALFAYAAAGATLVGILAAMVPARRAAQLDPAVAIRG